MSFDKESEIASMHKGRRSSMQRMADGEKAEARLGFCTCSLVRNQVSWFKVEFTLRLLHLLPEELLITCEA